MFEREVFVMRIRRFLKWMFLMAAFVLIGGGCGGSSDSNFSEFSGGSGTSEDPWQIAAVGQLDAVRNDLGAHYILTADLDLSGIANWEPIGSFNFAAEDESGYFEAAFSGVFDGNGHSISNVTSRASSEAVGVGLFGATSSAVIKNLTVRNVIADGRMAIGGIVGYNRGTVENLVLEGKNSITGYNCVGGILGGHEGGRISNCIAEATIYVLGDNDFSDGKYILSDINECGGIIVGGAFTGTISNCSAKGTVISRGHDAMGLGGVGGCLEYMESITNCTADVVIEAGKNAHGIGGLCGFAGTFDESAPAQISGCSVTVTINAAGGATHVGGLVGTGLFMSMYNMESIFEISDCRVTADINGAEFPGGVAGRAAGSAIKSCVADVTIDGNKNAPEIGATDRMFESAE
jgi:hypothetical protein